MTKGELMAIVIFYHHSGFRCMKWYYEVAIQKYLRSYFPDAFSYSHFVNSIRKVYQELMLYLFLCCMGKPTEANYVDSKRLEVCHIKREKQHKVFKDSAKKGKSSMGWFYGFKLHLLINQYGEFLNVQFTTGNTADNQDQLLRKLFHRFVGTVFGDRGYWSSIRTDLAQQGVDLIPKPKKVRTTTKKKGKEKKKPQAPSNEQKISQQKTLKIPITPKQKKYASKRGLIETVFGILTHQMDIDHTRHRSEHNAVINLVAGLIGYSFLDKKPTVAFVDERDFQKIVLF
jgi:hypothetical protein